MKPMAELPQSISKQAKILCLISVMKEKQMIMKEEGVEMKSKSFKHIIADFY